MRGKEEGEDRMIARGRNSRTRAGGRREKWWEKGEEICVLGGARALSREEEAAKPVIVCLD